MNKIWFAHDKIIRCVYERLRHEILYQPRRGRCRQQLTGTSPSLLLHILPSIIFLYTIIVGKPSIIYTNRYLFILLLGIYYFLVVNYVHTCTRLNRTIGRRPRPQVDGSPRPPWNAINSTLVSWFLEIIPIYVFI